METMNEHTAKTKCMTTFYAILRIPLEKKLDYNLEKTTAVLDNMVDQLRFRQVENKYHERSRADKPASRTR